ncbi:hypothetical protein M3Y98_00037700 [Aphelenchoides besseyi]|nr:hypothetical protein M3Y98_00037700 [Aphelenchoides besseyi]
MKKTEAKTNATAKPADSSTKTPTKTVTIQSPTDESEQTPKTEVPTPQTPKTSSWRKREQEKQKQERYSAFKAPPFPTYDPRAHSADRTSYYGNVPFVAHPDHLDVESIYGTQRAPSQLGNFYGERPSSRLSHCGFNGTMVDSSKFRPNSAMSGCGAMSERGFAISTVKMSAPPTYGQQVTEERIGKEIVNWTGLSLCSYLQLICGVCIAMIGVARMFMHAEKAMGQELFYGISAIIAGLIGNLAARNSNYSLAVASYVHSLVNALLSVVPFVSAILPMIPLLGIKSGAAFLQLSDSTEPLEADFVLAIFSLVQFVVGLFISIHGCRTAGTAIAHVEQLRFRTTACLAVEGTYKSEPITGRPLGFRRYDCENIVVVDAYLGVYKFKWDKRGEEKILSIWPSDMVVEGRETRFLNDIEIWDEKTWLLTDSSSRYQLRNSANLIIENAPTGSYYFTGKHKGRLEDFVGNLAGYPHSIRLSTQ